MKSGTLQLGRKRRKKYQKFLRGPGGRCYRRRGKTKKRKRKKGGEKWGGASMRSHGKMRRQKKERGVYLFNPCRIEPGGL